MSDNERLSKNQDKAIGALLSETTIQAAADRIGVSEPTLRRWLKQPDFLVEYREACRQVVDGAIHRLQAACSEAVSTLRDVMQDVTSPASSRVSAAKCILDTALRAVEVGDLEGRISALEDMANRRLAA